MKKVRWISLLLALCLSVGAFAGCGETKGSENNHSGEHTDESDDSIIDADDDADDEADNEAVEFTYSLNDEGTEYTISGLRGHLSGKVVLPGEYNGKPVTAIDAYAFEEENMSEVVIPEGITRIGQRAFYRCVSLESVTLPKSLTRIEPNAFSHTDLKAIEIPSGGVYIDGGVFSGCQNLKEILLPDDLTNLGVGAFRDTGYYDDASNWEEGTLYIGNYLVDFNSTIPNGYLRIKDGTVGIGDMGWRDTTCMTDIIIPSSVKMISGSLCLSGGANLKNIWCEADGSSDGWNENWRFGNSYVDNYWGNEWHFVDGVPTLYED